KNITVSIHTENVFYPCVDSDIKSLFKNLIENAIKYNKNEGTIDIKLTETKEHVNFVVKDSGIGIPKAHQTRIFERFYQVNKTRSKLQNGTGLGLAIVKHVVSYYDGNIVVESEEHMGTTFNITLKKPKVS
ncbi:MAG: two-component sensor histidine kinase, partial [Tenericutes bacterium HGW-Tenericutes-8]